jgi:hypothetical protein
MMLTLVSTCLSACPSSLTPKTSPSLRFCFGQTNRIAVHPSPRVSLPRSEVQTLLRGGSESFACIVDQLELATEDYLKNGDPEPPLP